MPVRRFGPPRPGYPVSPCNDVCTLTDDNICIGCKRTLGEIVAWSTMTADEQWDVVVSLKVRPDRT